MTNLHSLSVFNAATNILKSAAIAGLPRATRLSADGKCAYILDFDRKAILAFDTVETQSLVAPISMGIRKQWRSAPTANSFTLRTIGTAL